MEQPSNENQNTSAQIPPSQVINPQEFTDSVNPSSVSNLNSTENLDATNYPDRPDNPNYAHNLDDPNYAESPENSSYDNSTELKKRKNPWRPFSIIISLVALVSLVLLGVLYFYSNQKINESTSQIKRYQKELTDSKTIIAEYEASTKTQVVDTKNEADGKAEQKDPEKKPEKQIVKWNDLNVNFSQLATLIGDNFRILNGRIVTNSDGTLVIAKMAISPLEKQVDPNGLAQPSYVDHQMGIKNNVYVRKLPSGPWQYVGVFGFSGMGVVECKNVSEEMKQAVTVLNKYEVDPNMRYSCVSSSANGKSETIVFWS